MESGSTTASTSSPSDDHWGSVTDPAERRRIQNRNAQRRYREKRKQELEESDRAQDNRRRAAAAYTSPDAEDVDESGEMSGLPWGGLSFRHIIETGKAKEQSSRESSLNARASQLGGSSRVGLHLVDHYARGSPAWTAWRSHILALSAAATQCTQQPWSQAPMG